MKIIVITGSTRGIGYGLADAFLAKGHNVVVSGRNPETTMEAARSLGEKHDPQRVLGQPCDISDREQVQALWDAAVSRFGRVDIWVNNAGQAHGQTPVTEFTPEQIQALVGTNIEGTIYGTQVAMRGMKAQGGGAIYNMEGLGSRGTVVQGMALYGTSKAALHYFDEALAKEVDETGIITGSLNPGMVVTDLLTVQRNLDPAAWERQKKIFNILSERVETVAPALVDQMLKNTKNGAKLRYGSSVTIFWRFLTAPFSKRNVID